MIRACMRACMHDAWCVVAAELGPTLLHAHLCNQRARGHRSGPAGSVSRWLPAPASGRERPVRGVASGALHHLPRETGGGNHKQGQQLRLRACFCHQPAPPRRPGPAALAAHACAPAQARDCCATLGMCPGGASNDWLTSREREGVGAAHAACCMRARREAAAHGRLSGGAVLLTVLAHAQAHNDARARPATAVRGASRSR